MKKFLLFFVTLLASIGIHAADKVVTVTFSDLGLDDQIELESVAFDDNVTATFNMGNGTVASKYFDNGTAARIYGGNTMTVSTASGVIKNIEFTFGSKDVSTNEISVDKGEFNGSAWSGSESSVIFTFGGQRRISSISVTYEPAAAGTLTASPKEINLWGFAPATELYYNTHKAIFHVEAENCTENITYVMQSSGKAKGTTSPRITVATSGLYENRSGNLNVTCSSSKAADISDVVVIKSGDVEENVTVNVKIASTQYNGEGIFEEDWDECRPFTMADLNAIHAVMPQNTTWATEATHEYSMYFPKLRYFQGVVSAIAADASGKVTFTLADAEGDATVKVVEALYKEGQTALKAGDKVILSGDFGDVEGELQILTATIEEITADAPADGTVYGTFAAPAALEDGKTYGMNADVTGGQFNYYTFESAEDVKITLTTTPGTNPGGGFGVSTGNFMFDDQGNDFADAVMLGEDDITTEMVPAGGEEGGEDGEDGFGIGFGNFTISSYWNAKAGVKYYIMCQGVGKFNVALSEAETGEKVGTMTNPINLNETPTWTWGTDGKVPGSATHYTYTAEKDGNLTISNCNEDLYVGEDGWYDPFVNTGGPHYTGEIKKVTNWADYTAAYTFAVEEGVTYCITIFDLTKGNDGEVIKAEFEEAAPADEAVTIFKWANTENSADYTAEAGTVECTGGDKNDRINYPQADYLTLCLNGKKANLGDGSKDGVYIKVTPTQALKAGDVIAMTAFRNKDAMGKKSTALLIFDNDATAEIGANPEFPNINAAGENPGADPTTIELVVTEEMAGAKSINLTRGQTGTNLFITSLIITSASEDEVIPVESVSILDPGNEVANGQTFIFENLGESYQFTAIVTPENATNKKVTWEVLQDSEVVTCEEGLVTLVGYGKAAVVVTTEDGEKQAYVNIYVQEKEPEKEPATFEITNDGLNVTITPSNDEAVYTYAVLVPEVKALYEQEMGITDSEALFDLFTGSMNITASGTFTFNVIDDYFSLFGLEELEPGTEVEVMVAEAHSEGFDVIRDGEITTYKFIYGEGGGEEELPTGTYAEPIALEDGKTYGMDTAETGAPNFYTFESDKDVKIILTPTDGTIVEGGFGVSTGNFLMDDQFNDLEGAEPVEVEAEPVGGNEPGIGGDDDFFDDFGFGFGRMAYSWTAKAGVKYYIVSMGQGSFTVELAEAETGEKVGTIENPINLNETPEWTWGVDGKRPGSATHYTFTAEKDGKLAIKTSADTELNIGIDGWWDPYFQTEGPKYDGEVETTDYNLTTYTATYTFAVEEGVTYCITIFDLAGDVIKAEFTEATGIKGAAADKANGNVYNIRGQKVDGDTFRGIMIKNGVKVIKK